MDGEDVSLQQDPYEYVVRRGSLDFVASIYEFYGEQIFRKQHVEKTVKGRQITKLITLWINEKNRQKLLVNIPKTLEIVASPVVLGKVILFPRSINGVLLTISFAMSAI